MQDQTSEQIITTNTNVMEAVKDGNANASDMAIGMPVAPVNVRAVDMVQVG